MALAEYGNALNIDTDGSGNPILVDPQSGDVIAIYDRASGAWQVTEIEATTGDFDSVNTEELTYELESQPINLAGSVNVETAYQNTSGTAILLILQVQTSSADTTAWYEIKVSETDADVSNTNKKVGGIREDLDATFSSVESVIVPDGYWYYIDDFSDRDASLLRVAERELRAP